MMLRVNPWPLHRRGSGSGGGLGGMARVLRRSCVVAQHAAPDRPGSACGPRWIDARQATSGCSASVQAKAATFWACSRTTLGPAMCAGVVELDVELAGRAGPPPWPRLGLGRVAGPMRGRRPRRRVRRHGSGRRGPRVRHLREHLRRRHRAHDHRLATAVRRRGNGAVDVPPASTRPHAHDQVMVHPRRLRRARLRGISGDTDEREWISVGAARYTGAPAPQVAGTRLFTFIT